MYMNDKKIDELIDRVLQEEQLLPEGLSRRLEQQIDAWAVVEKKRSLRPIHKRMLYGLCGVAASILLCLALFQYGVPSHTPECFCDTYTNPQDAAVAAEKALLLLSQNLNKGLQQVDNAGQEIDKINTILNKHLND